MSPDREIDLVLTTWLEDGPTGAPDRVLDVLADRIAHQRQRPAWRLDWRLTTMQPMFKISVGIAAVVLVAIVGWNLVPGSGSGIGGPGTTPSPPPLPEGRLTAGDYVMRTLEGDPMAFVISAPEGWTGFGGFFLGGPHQSGAPNGIGISVNHDPQVNTEPCVAVPTPPPGSRAPSVDDIVAAISAREDLQVSGVTDTVLAGYAGKRLDLQFPAELPCSNAFVFAEPKGLYANGPANRWRVWLLDVDGETGVVVLLDYAGTPAADRAAAQAAIDSIRITR